MLLLYYFIAFSTTLLNLVSQVMHILIYRNTHFWRLVDSNFISSLPLTCSRSTPTDGVTCKCLSHAHAHALAQCRLIEPLAVICDRPIHQVRQRTHRSASASATRRRRPDIPFPIQYNTEQCRC